LLALAGVAVARDRSVNHGSVLLALYTGVPLLLVFAVSFISPVFIERYLTAYALGLPMLAGLAIDRLYSRVRVLAIAVLVSLIGVEMIGVNTNATVDPNDQFNVMVDQRHALVLELRLLQPHGCPDPLVYTARRRWPFDASEPLWFRHAGVR
jgi:hypothetical protein